MEEAEATGGGAIVGGAWAQEHGPSEAALRKARGRETGRHEHYGSDGRWHSLPPTEAPMATLDEMRADGYAPDAASAVGRAQSLLG